MERGPTGNAPGTSLGSEPGVAVGFLWHSRAQRSVDGEKNCTERFSHVVSSF